MTTNLHHTFRGEAERLKCLSYLHAPSTFVRSRYHYHHGRGACRTNCPQAISTKLRHRHPPSRLDSTRNTRVLPPQRFSPGNGRPAAPAAAEEAYSSPLWKKKTRAASKGARSPRYTHALAWDRNPRRQPSTSRSSWVRRKTARMASDAGPVTDRSMSLKGYRVNNKNDLHCRKNLLF